MIQWFQESILSKVQTRTMKLTVMGCDYTVTCEVVASVRCSHRSVESLFVA